MGDGDAGTVHAGADQKLGRDAGFLAERGLAPAREDEGAVGNHECGRLADCPAGGGEATEKLAAFLARGRRTSLVVLRSLCSRCTAASYSRSHSPLLISALSAPRDAVAGGGVGRRGAVADRSRGGWSLSLGKFSLGDRSVDLG